MKISLVALALLSACADSPAAYEPDAGPPDSDLQATTSCHGLCAPPPPALLWCVPLAVPDGCPAVPAMTCVPTSANLGYCRTLGQYLPDLATCSSTLECGPGAVCGQAPDGIDRCVRICDTWDGVPGCVAPLACRSVDGVSALGYCVW